MGNDSGKFIFIQMHNDRQNELKVSGELSWTELSEEFFSFLQGSGYVLSRQDFADYWAQYMDDIKFDSDNYHDEVFYTDASTDQVSSDDISFDFGDTMNDTGAQVFENIKVDLTSGNGAVGAGTGHTGTILGLQDGPKWGTTPIGAGSPYTVQGDSGVTYKFR